MIILNLFYAVPGKKEEETIEELKLLIKALEEKGFKRTAEEQFELNRLKSRLTELEEVKLKKEVEAEVAEKEAAEAGEEAAVKEAEAAEVTEKAEEAKTRKELLEEALAKETDALKKAEIMKEIELIEIEEKEEKEKEAAAEAEKEADEAEKEKAEEEEKLAKEKEKAAKAKGPGALRRGAGKVAAAVKGGDPVINSFFILAIGLYVFDLMYNFRRHNYILLMLYFLFATILTFLLWTELEYKGNIWGMIFDRLFFIGISAVVYFLPFAKQLLPAKYTYWSNLAIMIFIAPLWIHFIFARYRDRLFKVLRGLYILVIITIIVFASGPTIAKLAESGWVGLLGEEEVDVKQTFLDFVLKGQKAFTETAVKQFEKGKLVRKRLEKELLGEYSKAEEDETIKEFVGLRFPEIYFVPKEFQAYEPIMIESAIEFYSYKEEIAPELSCYILTEKQLEEEKKEKAKKKKPTKKAKPVLRSVEGAEKCSIKPAILLKDIRGYEDLVVRIPKDLEVWGNNEVVIQVDIPNYFSQSYLKNNFIDKDVYREMKKALQKREQKSIEEKSAATMLFSDLKTKENKGYSIYDPGFVMISKFTKPGMPLIGIKEGDSLTFHIALGNAAEGAITNVNTVEVYLPVGFKVTPGSEECEYWKVSQDETGKYVLSLSADYIKKIDFGVLKKNEIKPLPPCSLEVDSEKLNQLILVEDKPNPGYFLADVKFDYALQKIYKFKVEKPFELLEEEEKAAAKKKKETEEKETKTT